MRTAHIKINRPIRGIPSRLRPRRNPLNRPATPSSIARSTPRRRRPRPLLRPRTGLRPHGSRSGRLHRLLRSPRARPGPGGALGDRLEPRQRPQVLLRGARRADQAGAAHRAVPQEVQQGGAREGEARGAPAQAGDRARADFL
ncbi:unnamed protein product [Phyllotreta striolata]|uniref:Uncharacterized protein n=1 Tax=Phyllotreta striolata TaxID=444603 RepID=A0A9N9XNJ5_PHYSR|nr:unnamed protein product [Phyllotreta striolata]